MSLRDYQQELVAMATAGEDNVLLQADTGAGKTRVLAELAKSGKPTLIVAHRNLLISQLSLEFARCGVAHTVHASDATRRSALLRQRRELGRQVKESRDCFVVSLDKLLAEHRGGRIRLDQAAGWQILVDEAHHMIDENKWGKLQKIFPAARFVGATATPVRLDGVSLRRGRGGVFDRLAQASALEKDSVSTLIKAGHLSEFRCFGVDSRLDENRLILGKHDYTADSLGAEARRHVNVMAGDAVEHYRAHASNTQAVVFCTTIDTAEETARVFRSAGVSAAAIHSKLGGVSVRRAFQAFSGRSVRVIVNVDMIGEGIDVPHIESAILLRKTASFGLFRQWIGRALRPAPGKKHAVILDHADNIRQHGLPDRDVKWTLDGAANIFGPSNLAHCKQCGYIMRAWLDYCPECGAPLRQSDLTTHDMKFLDMRLIEIHRSAKVRKKRDDTIASDVPIDDVRHLRKGGSDMPSRVSEKVAFWFFEAIRDVATRSQVEQFMMKNNHFGFWVKHFHVSDLKSKCPKKRLEVWRAHAPAQL